MTAVVAPRVSPVCLIGIGPVYLPHHCAATHFAGAAAPGIPKRPTTTQRPPSSGGMVYENVNVAGQATSMVGSQALYMSSSEVLPTSNRAGKKLQ